MHKTSLTAIAASLIIAATAAWAQQPGDPHHPPAGGAQPDAAPAQPPAPSPAAAGAPAAPGGMPMMQMMMGRGGMMPMPAGSMPTGPMTGDGSGAPISVIINIGPGIHVDVSDAGAARGGATPSRMPAEMMRGARGGMSMQGAAPAMMATERVEGRLAFLRAELGITDAQREAWERYAQAIRAAAARDRDARAAAPGAEGGAAGRLAREEALLAAALERVHADRAALDALLPLLGETQRRTLDQLLALPMPGAGPQAGMMTR